LPAIAYDPFVRASTLLAAAEIVGQRVGVSARRTRMNDVMVAGRAEASEAPGKPLLRGIHHLALVTADMRMTLDFYVRVLGMPLVHGLRTPSPPPGAGPAHGVG